MDSLTLFFLINLLRARNNSKMAPVAVDIPSPDVALQHGQYKEQAPGPKDYKQSVEEEEAAVRDRFAYSKTNRHLS